MKAVAYKLTYDEYRLLMDVLYKYKDKQFELQDKITALKSNPSYRALFKKDYLERAEKEKTEVDLIIKALDNLKML